MQRTSDLDLDLEGPGAAYIRTSDDQQDTARQYNAADVFQGRHRVSIPRSSYFVDEGWARDTAERRPAFNRMLRLAQDGFIKWLFVDKLDRFGWKSTKQLQHYLFLLSEAGCRLYDQDDREWTAEDDATELSVWVDGKKAVKEPRDLSHRVLGGMVERARNGEWLGGAVRLGFDIGCFNRETQREQWRVVLQGRELRLKVFPDGKSERWDGKGNFPPYQGGKKNGNREYLQLVPTKDKAKLAAAVNVFERYAGESISFSALAHHLNALGQRSCYGKEFESRSVEDMLADPIFLGRASWNKLHQGKFNRYADSRPNLEINLKKKQSRNKPSDWVQSGRRLFEPLVSLEVWNAVQEKLANRKTRAKAPNSSKHYLSGLLVCGNCQSHMTSGRNDHGRLDRIEYQCGSYTKAVRYKGKKKEWECSCLRNGVFQVELEWFIERYLTETGAKLEVLRGRQPEGTGTVDHLDEQLDREQDGCWRSMNAAIDRLQSYLEKYAPDSYREACGEWTEGHADAWDVWVHDPDYVRACIDVYRRTFDPARVSADLAELDALHNRLMDKLDRMTTKLAIAKVNAELEQVEAQMETLRQQQTDAAAIVEAQLRELNAMQDAIGKARQALKQGGGERSLRQKAEAVRRVIGRIECTFTATPVAADKKGRRGGGWGKKSSELASVTIYPLIGNDKTYRAVSQAESVVPISSGSPPPNDTALTP
jgi:DNA invertase Pin-like site-specific DNA recombinase